MSVFQHNNSLQSKASTTNFPGKATYSVIVSLIMVCSINVSTASIDVNVAEKFHVRDFRIVQNLLPSTFGVFCQTCQLDLLNSDWPQPLRTRLGALKMQDWKIDWKVTNLG